MINNRVLIIVSGENLQKRKRKVTVLLLSKCIKMLFLYYVCVGSVAERCPRESIMKQRGNIRKLPGICEFHSSYF